MNESYESRTRQLSGERFGRWLVVRQAESDKRRGARWHCVCACGVQRVVRAQLLVTGQSKSCGCLRKERVAEANRKRLLRHGMTAGGNSRTYRIWANMMTRCTNPNASNWMHYGGRGIAVCDRWKSFENFFRDVGVIPKGMSIDRIDTNGDYSPGNTRIIKFRMQARNKRCNRNLTIDGRTMSLVSWSEQPGAAKYGTIWMRLRRGWDTKRAVFEAARL